MCAEFYIYMGRVTFRSEKKNVLFRNLEKLIIYI